MKERPILFNSQMVRAILDGRKTQTRRPMKVQPQVDGCQLAWLVSPAKKHAAGKAHWVKITDKMVTIHNDPRYFSCPFGTIGDRLWVRESFCPLTNDQVIYKADFFGNPHNKKWAPSINMPRWASRILLEVVDVRIERLSDMPEANAKAEGFETYGDFVLAFDEIYKNKRLPQNPYLWVCEFKILEKQ